MNFKTKSKIVDQQLRLINLGLKLDNETFSNLIASFNALVRYQGKELDKDQWNSLRRSYEI